MQQVFTYIDVIQILIEKGYRCEKSFRAFDIPCCIGIKFPYDIKPLIPEKYYNKFNIFRDHTNIHTTYTLIEQKEYGFGVDSSEFWELLVYMARDLPNNPFT